MLARRSSDAALRRLRADGGNSVAIVATWYQERTSSSRVLRIDTTPTDSAVLHAMRTARSLGLHVMLKPHVDVFDGSWRGDIVPADPAPWWRSYGAMIEHYARLARRGGAEILAVGTELKAREGDLGQWTALIGRVRRSFHGKLTYAANWDSFEAPGFWGLLDYIGIDAYFPLAAVGATDPPVDDLVAGWQPWVGRIKALHDRFGKPVMFTEIGYQDRVGVAATPAFTGAPVAALPQQHAYQAALRVWASVPWFQGMYWWAFRAFGHRAGDGNWDPQGKPAERALADAYRANPFAHRGATLFGDGHGDFDALDATAPAVAYAYNDHGMDNTGDGWTIRLYVANLRTGRVRLRATVRRPDACRGDSELPGVSDIAVSSRGSVAWIEHACRTEVRAFDGDGARVLDAGPGIVEDSLCLAGSTLTWRDAAGGRSVTLR